MKKHSFLETMTAKEFVDCLEDFGLYNMAIDTMVSTIEKQGRNSDRSGIVDGNVETPAKSDEIIASLNDLHDGKVFAGIDIDGQNRWKIED